MKTKYFYCTAGLLALSSIAFGQTLSGKLATLDSLLFNAVLNTCDMKYVEGTFTSDFCYQQDKGNGMRVGVTSRSEFVRNIVRRCAVKTVDFKVRRELIKGCISVEPLGQTAATQTGIQRFYVKTGSQPEQLVEESHFTRLWILEKGNWMIRRELDYQINTPSPQETVAQSDSLFQQVTAADSALFTAYNHKEIAPMKTIFAHDLEFYHDKGGLSHYDDNIANFEQKFKDPNFYSRREVDKSSLKVFPLNNYGAVETGVHRFYSMVDGKETLSATANFINTWHYTGDCWKLERVISYDHH